MKKLWKGYDKQISKQFQSDWNLKPLFELRTAHPKGSALQKPFPWWPQPTMTSHGMSEPPPLRSAVLQGAAGSCQSQPHKSMGSANATGHCKTTKIPASQFYTIENSMNLERQITLPHLLHWSWKASCHFVPSRPLDILGPPRRPSLDLRKHSKPSLPDGICKVRTKDSASIFGLRSTLVIDRRWPGV